MPEKNVPMDDEEQREILKQEAAGVPPVEEHSMVDEAKRSVEELIANSAAVKRRRRTELLPDLLGVSDEVQVEVPTLQSMARVARERNRREMESRMDALVARERLPSLRFDLEVIPEAFLVTDDSGMKQLIVVPGSLPHPAKEALAAWTRMARRAYECAEGDDDPDFYSIERLEIDQANIMGVQYMLTPDAEKETEEDGLDSEG